LGEIKTIRTRILQPIAPLRASESYQEIDEPYDPLWRVKKVATRAVLSSTSGA
jgi:hypothetical protein